MTSSAASAQTEPGIGDTVKLSRPSPSPASRRTYQLPVAVTVLIVMGGVASVGVVVWAVLEFVKRWKVLSRRPMSPPSGRNARSEINSTVSNRRPPRHGTTAMAHRRSSASQSTVYSSGTSAVGGEVADLESASRQAGSTPVLAPVLESPPPPSVLVLPQHPSPSSAGSVVSPVQHSSSAFSKWLPKFMKSNVD
jgi:hypothetical protein